MRSGDRQVLVKGGWQYYLDGKPVTKKEYNRRHPEKPIGTPAIINGDHWRNHESVGLSVHPMQAKEFNEAAQKAGITGVRYESDGKCIVSSRGSLKSECERRGVFNRDAGYGDAVPRNV